MKQIRLAISAIAILVFATISAVSLSSCQSKSDAATKQVTEQAAVINIPTAKCSSCARHIKGAVKALDGVTGITVSTEAHTAQVKFDPNKTSVKAIDAAIAKSGYTADNVVRDSAAYAGLDDCCK